MKFMIRSRMGEKNNCTNFWSVGVPVCVCDKDEQDMIKMQGIIDERTNLCPTLKLIRKDQDWSSFYFLLNFQHS